VQDVQDLLAVPGHPEGADVLGVVEQVVEGLTDQGVVVSETDVNHEVFSRG